VIKLVNWPRWRFEEEEEEGRAQEEVKFARRKEEAAEALAKSYEQLERVKEIRRTHEPVAKGLKTLRQANQFADGFLRAIQEGK
jgi:hypothetical protein